MFCVRPKPKCPQRHCVHCHERQERSKIQDLHRALPTHRQRARIGEKANDGHVLTWVSAVDIEVSEDSARQKIVASHAAKKTYRAQVACESARQT